MFKHIKYFFQGKSSLKDQLGKESKGAADPKEVKIHINNLQQIATAVLLVEVAAADNEIVKQEAEAVCRVMQHQLGIPEDEVPQLVEIAVESRKKSGKIDEFVEILADRLGIRERQVILAMIWKVVIADGKIDDFEKEFAADIQYRFRLTDAQGKEARKMADEGTL